VLGRQLGENVGCSTQGDHLIVSHSLMFRLPLPGTGGRFCPDPSGPCQPGGPGSAGLIPSFPNHPGWPIPTWPAGWLARGQTAELREKLCLEVLFENQGRLQLQRLESLLAVGRKYEANPTCLPGWSSRDAPAAGPRGAACANGCC